jgi:branched-chain amino acid aminotransferase
MCKVVSLIDLVHFVGDRQVTCKPAALGSDFFVPTMTATASIEFSVTRSAHPRSDEERAKILANPGFGVNFTDHMVGIDWTIDKGWHNARVQPYGPLSLDPACSVLHYAQEIFEGLKAYRHADGSVWAFRPRANAARMQRSAQRLALPPLPEAEFLESIRQLVMADKDWVPSAPETSLYLRPFSIASERFLGVRAAQQASYYVIASPAGAYFSKGVAPVSIWVSEHYTRAARGGTGAAKCGGNYSASLLPQQEAQKQGCSQVLFLDAEEGTYLEELGGMNLFLVRKDGSLLTPSLTGSILEGVTRDSLIRLAKDQGRVVEERKITLEEVQVGMSNGEITEAFACGTAAVITPICAIKGKGFVAGHENGPAGELTMSLRRALTDIQYGRAADPHGWMMRLA